MDLLTKPQNHLRSVREVKPHLLSEQNSLTLSGDRINGFSLEQLRNEWASKLGSMNQVIGALFQIH